MTDLTQLYPEGLAEIIPDYLIDMAKDYYGKDNISQDELDYFLESQRNDNGRLDTN